MSCNHNVFCPKEIWRLPLSCIDRMFLSHVYHMQFKSDDKKCLTTNAELAEEFGVSVSTIGKMIKRLEEWEYIKTFIKMTDPPMWWGMSNPIAARHITINTEKVR